MTKQNFTSIPVRLSDETAPSRGYEIRIGSGLLEDVGAFARQAFPTTTERVCLISNPKVFGLYGERAAASLNRAGLNVATWLMRDGERFKNWRSLETALRFFSAERLSRSDAVVALGGGVVGDLAGFAAAIYLRGIPFIQVPTTLLAQIDSSVGGKTGVNSDFGKNLIGAFHQPRGVLIDLETLATLPRRELSAGFCEAVKHGILAGENLFNQTDVFLQNFPAKNFKRHFAAHNAQLVENLQNLICANIAFKARVVADDEREDASRDDACSRRILNLGHTVGHALEKITDYRRFKHGEAVGYGILAAAEISNKLGKLPKHELGLFYDVLRLAGKPPSASDLSPDKIIEAFAHDKKSVGDSFKWILPTALGRVEILDDRFVTESIVRDSLQRAVLNI